MNDDVDDIRKRKLEDLQRKYIAQQKKELKKQIQLQQQIELLEGIAKQYMTSDAISRYGNLKAAHPDKAIQAVAIIAQAVESGQLKYKLDDESFKKLLQQITPEKKEFKIKRI
ncbi:MAG: DNA-binding protein [Candidatus Nanoarchaeia archaeon]